MTILEKYQRRQDRASLLKDPMSRAKRELYFKKFKKRRSFHHRSAIEQRIQESLDLPQLDASTVRAVKAEVVDLLRPGPCTVVAMANALASSTSVLTLHAGGQDYSLDRGLLPRLRQLGFRKSNRPLQRRYELLRAFNKLETSPDSTKQKIHNWEDARQVLDSILTFPTEEEARIEENIVAKSTDSVQQYMRRHQLNVIKDMGSRILSSTADKKWRQIIFTPIPEKIGKEGQIKDEVDSLEAKESFKSVADVDAALKLRLDKEYEKRDARPNKAVVDLEERMALKEERLKEEEAKKRALSLMRPLTEAEKEVVNKAMYGLGPPNEVLAELGMDSVQRQSMQRLQPGQWLNDEVVHFFLMMLSKRDEELCKQDSTRSRSHFFKSFFLTKLLNEGNANPALDGKYEYKSVKRWSKKVPGKDIFKLDKIIFPINQGRMHWLCAVAYMKEKRIQLYDSMGAGGNDLYYVEHIFQYIQDEHKDKKKSPLPDIDQWKLVPCSLDTPQQKNSFDCGVYTCMFADFLSKGDSLVFTQEHITQCRQRIALSIMNGSAIM